nr:MAG TPA: hypothetical protein [Caudoviricetes sp.]
MLSLCGARIIKFDTQQNLRRWFTIIMLCKL